MTQTEDVEPTRRRGRSQDHFDVIDVRQLLWVWMKWSWLVLILAGIGAYLGIQTLREATPVYQAAMVVQPAEGSEGISNSVAQVSSALGINVSGRSAGGTTFGRLQVLLHSVTLARRLQGEHQLLQRVYGGQWDAKLEVWKPPTGASFERNQRIRRFLGLPGWLPPNVEDLANFLRGNIEIKESDSEGFFEVTVRSADPAFAELLLKEAYFSADEITREQDLIESERRREYIQRELLAVGLLDSRQALIGLLTAEERKAMLLKSDLPYAARIIEPPYVSTRPEEPDVRFSILFPALLWGVGGLVLITFVALLRRS
jgi:hypothetical protein